MPQPKILVDSNVLIDGILSHNSASKAFLIIAKDTQLFDLFISQVSIEEIEDFFVSKGIEKYIDDYTKYIDSIKITYLPLPDESSVIAAKTKYLPLLRHLADLPILLTAINSKMDWIISNNRDHFNNRLSKKINIKIASAKEFLEIMEIQNQY